MTDTTKKGIGRRAFLKGSALTAVAAGCATTTTPSAAPKDAAETEKPAKIRAHRVLGRTGWRVSDIGLGSGRLADSNVIRYAYDRGVNYFDTAEMYGNGDSERKIGQALKHIDRSKVWITTKLVLRENDTRQTILDRYYKCLERLQTPYADALYIHSCTNLKHIKHEGFHAAVGQLKSDGKLRHAGISSHGPRAGAEGDSMEQVLLAAVEDGRFDLMLLVYNFLRKDAGNKILKACKEKNVGATLMKTSPARLKLDPVDPNNLTDEYAGFVDRVMKRGMNRADAIEMLKKRVGHQASEMATHRTAIDAFVAQHGVKAELELRRKSILWSNSNPNASTAVVSMPDFEAVDRFLPLSGQTLSAADRRLLDDYAATHGNQYCRHGCTDCASACPAGVPVSTVMRYAYYFETQGREKHAMQRYHALAQNAAACVGCPAPCESACPNGLAVPIQLSAAHARLSLEA